METLNTQPLFDLFLRNGSFEEFQDLFWQLYVLTKHIDWAYEKEWRILCLARTSATHPDKCINNIIFGLRMPEDQRNEIRSILHGRSVEYFEAIEGGREFTLNIRMI